MMLGMGFGPLFGLVALLLIGWGVITVMNSNRYRNQPFWADGATHQNFDAIEILKQRYAKGEISKDEFEQMKKELL